MPYCTSASIPSPPYPCFGFSGPPPAFRAAFLTAILFSTNPWFWCATGWDHVTGAAIAYLLLGMACLAAAAEMPSRGWLPTLAGMSLTGAVIAHLFLAAFVPLVLLYYAGMVWARQDPLKTNLSHAAPLAGGGIPGLTVPALRHQRLSD